MLDWLMAQSFWRMNFFSYTDYFSMFNLLFTNKQNLPIIENHIKKHELPYIFKKHILQQVIKNQLQRYLQDKSCAVHLMFIHRINIEVNSQPKCVGLSKSPKIYIGITKQIGYLHANNCYLNINGSLTNIYSVFGFIDRYLDDWCIECIKYPHYELVLNYVKYLR